ncbi:hypothetical protein [Aestuariivirga sp.]|uniref:hypothetical protein n=1 Tax=Aestuariivirga sp. TaxID=2650926 RepID=UPI003592FF4A
MSRRPGDSSELSGCIWRCLARMGPLVRAGSISDEDAKMVEVTRRAFAAVIAAMKPRHKAT